MTRFVAATLFGVAAGLDSAAAAEGPEARSGPVLTVGVPAEPSIMAGFDRDLFAELARDRGVGVVWVTTTPGDALADLDAGRFEVAAGPFSPRRSLGHRMLPPVASAGDVLLKRRGDGAVLKPGDMAGKVVGLLHGAAASLPLRAMATVLHAHAAVRPSLGLGEEDLAAGRVAALAGPLPDVATAALARPEAFEVVGPPFGGTARLGFVMRATPEAAALAAALGTALGRMRADGRLAVLQHKWFGLVFDPPDAPTAPVHGPTSTSKP